MNEKISFEVFKMIFQNNFRTPDASRPESNFFLFNLAPDNLYKMVP